MTDDLRSVSSLVEELQGSISCLNGAPGGRPAIGITFAFIRPDRMELDILCALLVSSGPRGHHVSLGVYKIAMGKYVHGWVGHGF